MRDLLIIFVSTFVSEDLTAAATGLFVGQGRVGLVVGTLVCAAGIYVGDLGLWIAGRLLDRRLALVERFRVRHPEAARRWQHAPAPLVILASRVVPGSRLPLYLAAGAGGTPFPVFAMWSFAAVALWTPPIVLVTAASSAAGGAQGTAGISTWVPGAAAALFGLACCRAVPWLFRRHAGPLRRGWVHIRVALSRTWRWEFWPMWLFYGPVAAWTLWLALRHGGYRVVTAANPGIPDGGVVGESKYGILRRLPSRWTLPAVFIGEGAVRERLRRLLAGMRAANLAWPVILKPDVGQRGAGVRLARNLNDARRYLALVGGPVIAQRYHAGPHEAGIFYYRLPGWRTGRILSVTDKHFPFVVGDGSSSLERLVLSHPRYRMQARTFLSRLNGRRHRVPAAGERVALALAGNHAQGTMFRDGAHLVTPALEARIDRIARAYAGFFVGRFDVRYASVDAFKAGRDLAIVELNGATAEPTDIYDPDHSLLTAYRGLFRQWSIVFAIGAANRARGAAVSPASRLLSLIRAHLSSPAMPVGD